MADQSNEMVRRVADALFKNANYGVPGTVELSRQYESVQARYCGMARDAIEAMRDLTEPMIVAMLASGAWGTDEQLRADWAAAIDAVLSHDEVKG